MISERKVGSDGEVALQQQHEPVVVSYARGVRDQVLHELQAEYDAAKTAHDAAFNALHALKEARLAAWDRLQEAHRTCI